MKPALLVVDTLYEFVHGRLKSPEAESIIPVIRRLVDEAHRLGVPVIHVVDQHLPVDHEFQVWGVHALAGSSEARVVDELEPSREDYVLGKRSYSGFRDTGLDTLLRDLGVDTLVVTGIHTHICVLHTVWDAFYYGYRVYVVRDGVAAFSREDHDYALKYMERVYGARVIGLENALEVIHGREV